MQRAGLPARLLLTHNPLPTHTPQASNTGGIKVGDWVRLWMPNPNNTRRRRRTLLSTEQAEAVFAAGSASSLGRKLRDEPEPPRAKVSVAGVEGAGGEGEKVTASEAEVRAEAMANRAPVYPNW